MLEKVKLPHSVIQYACFSACMFAVEKLCIGWRQDDVRQECGYGSRWWHSLGIKSREGTGDHLQDWIPISFWSNCSCFSAFCHFRLVPHFQFYLISLNLWCLTSSCCAFVFIHFLIPVCIFSSLSHSLCDTEFISCHLAWLQSHFHMCIIIRWHMTPWPYTTSFLHQSNFFPNGCQFGQ